MKNNTLFAWVFLLVASQQLWAQPTERFRSQWLKGHELFELKLFASAQSALFEEAEISKGLGKEYTEYRAVVSGLELLNADAESLAEAFEENYPNSALLTPMQLFTAEHFFRIRRYKNAYIWYSKVDVALVDSKKREEIKFKKAYSSFIQKDFNQASQLFSEVAANKSEFSASSSYYKSFIQYTDSAYSDAALGFESLKSDAQFGDVVPYYLAQIYYKTGRYSELIDLANDILNREEVVRRDEIEHLVADAYYRKAKYTDAAIHFERYKELGKSFRQQDHYQLGYSYYQMGRYPEAIQSFNKITQSNGPLSQDAWYHLGDCYLKTNDKAKALTAFSSASKANGNDELAQQARFIYAKLNYELDGPYEAVDKVIQDYLSDYPSSPNKKELNSLLAQLYLTQKDYEKAMQSIRAIDKPSIELKAAYQKAAYFRGIEWFNATQYQKAAEMFIESRSNPIQSSYLALSHYWEAESYYRRKMSTEALASFDLFRRSTGAQATSEYILSEYDIAYTYFSIKDYQKAAQNFRSFTIQYSKEDALKADARVRAADCYFVTGGYLVALDYYSQALKFNSREADYALLQKANCEGLLSKYNDKIASLERLNVNYPNSRYAPEAAYEKAATLLKLDRNAEALAAMEKFRMRFPDHSLVRVALLNEGLILRNLERLEESADRLRTVVETYPSTEEANEAISFTRLVYSDMGRIDDYIEWVQKIDFADVKQVQLDSTLFNSAYELYAFGDCEKAENQLKQYLNRFQNGLFLRRVRFYLADCLEKQNKMDEALLQWDAIHQMGNGDYKDLATQKLAKKAFRDKEYSKARSYFISVSQSEDASIQRESTIYLMRLAVIDQLFPDVISLSTKVLLDDKSAPEWITEAQLERARANYSLDKLNEARADFIVLYQNPKGISAAEAGYYLARILQREGRITESVDKVYEAMDRIPSFGKWKEESLFLLVENFLSLDDLFQANYTLDFIEKNPNDESSKQRALTLRNAMEKAEQNSSEENKKEEPAQRAADDLYLDENSMPFLEMPTESPENE